MKKILLSTALILFVGSAFALSGTGAFFGDTEVSSGNTFTAGAIDLKIDNESYYNGNACVDVNELPEVDDYRWTGNASYPVPGTTCTTSWELDELNDGEVTLHKFFDFLDLKPGDYSEDTISLHVDTNDSYLCANVTLTSNDDNGLNEPEALVDSTGGAGEGELGDNVNFIWWADDGDNILENDEEVISQGPIGDIGVGNSYPIVLADSDQNIWTGVGGPVPGDETLYIGKAWCFGTITPTPVGQDGSGILMSPAGDNDGNQTPGQATDGGYSCNGAGLNNVTQTDSLTADISFSAVQARNNPNYQCTVPGPRTGTLIVRKVLINDDNGTLENFDDFSFTVNAGASTPFESDGENQIEVLPGTYDVAEDFEGGYGTIYENCSNVDIAIGETEICTITNNDIEENQQLPAKLIVNKIVVNDNGGNNNAPDFQMTVNGSNVDQGIANDFSPGSHTVSEFGVSGYVASFSGDCDANGDVVLVTGQTKTCTVTNNDLPGNITLIKNVINNNGGGSNATSFTLRIDGGVVPNNTSVAVSANTPHSINEDSKTGYTFVSITGNAKCPAVLGGTATLDEGEAITCTITNDDTSPLVESFGTGTCAQDIAGWDEDPGESCVNGTVAAAIGTGDDTASPDGGRFALIGNAGYICKAVNATGLEDLVFKYYWRGDGAADAGDLGSIRFFTGGTCAAPTGEIITYPHDLTVTSWSTLQNVNLPASIDNTTFLVRFTADTNNGNESFRVDGMTITGTAI